MMCTKCRDSVIYGQIDNEVEMCVWNEAYHCMQELMMNLDA